MTKQIKLGTTGPDVHPFALGCMSMGAGSWYGKSSDDEGIATIHAAIEHGVNLIDTGDFYGMGKNELLIGKALAGAKRDKVVLSVKYGAQRGPDGAFLGIDTSPAATKAAVAYSLSRLGVDYIDVYRPSRLDPRVPIEDTIGAIRELITAGYVRHVSLSEVGVDTIRRAAKVHPIADLQIEYSLVSRGPEANIFPALAELGIAVTAYSVLGRGLLTGSKPTGATDARAHLPRFHGDNGEKNQALVATLARVAADKKATPAQLAIAWVRAKGAALGVTVLPTIGARTVKQLTDALGGMDLALSATDLASIEQAMPEAAGARYPQAMMAHLDSER
jgi:aryl-alcohol dehydrogenase-like predicted oxidoreductase